MKEPEAVFPLLQIVPDGLLRETFQLPQRSPALQSGFFVFQRLWLPHFVHAGKDRKQHRQQQQQHGRVLGRHLPCQVHVLLRMDQRIRQRNFLHGIVRQTDTDPGFRQQVKLNFLHQLPPFHKSDHSHGHNGASSPPDGPSAFHPAVAPAPRAASGRAAIGPADGGCPLPARQ